jgi:hypothetical protein
VLPAATGNGTESADTVDVDPPEPLVLVLVFVLLGAVLDEPDAPELPELPVLLLEGELLHAASSRPVAVTQAASRQARPEAGYAGRFIS